MGLSNDLGSKIFQLNQNPNHSRISIFFMFFCFSKIKLLCILIFWRHHVHVLAEANKITESLQMFQGRFWKCHLVLKPKWANFVDDFSFLLSFLKSPSVISIGPFFWETMRLEFYTFLGTEILGLFQIDSLSNFMLEMTTEHIPAFSGSQFCYFLAFRKCLILKHRKFFEKEKVNFVNVIIRWLQSYFMWLIPIYQVNFS